MTIYNPHLLDRRDLIDTFVARQPLLGELLDDLRRGGGQHHLLVGNRGSGKTTLLLRLAMAIEDDAQLAKKCIPLRFPEEQYNVARLSDFWLNAADALVDALERQGNHAAAQQIEAAVAELEPLDEDDRSKRSRMLLEISAKQIKRKVVLLVDNIDLVLDRLAESHWELREALSTDNRLVVIGASSKFLEEAIDYQSPFYDFFRVHELEPLSEAEARRVVLALAERAGTPNVAGVLERDPGRFKALFALTGGTPRTLALLHTVLAVEQRGSVERDLDGLLDQLTPYYKARFDDLPALSQVVVDKIALHWHPMTAAGCQAATHVEINTVSAQLHRLVKAGVLTKVELPGGSKLGFQLSERFFNIWYLMRASRRLRRRLTWFVEFLRIFYGEEELRTRAEQLVREAPPDTVNTPAKLLAFAAAISDEPLRRRLESGAVALLAQQSVTAIREVMDLEGEDVHLAPIIDRVRTLRELRARVAAADVRWPDGLTSDAMAEALMRHPLIPLAHKRLLVERIERSQDAAPRSVVALLTDEMSTLVPQPLVAAISTGEVAPLGDVTTFVEIVQAIDLAGSGPEVITALVLATETARKPLSLSLLRQVLDHRPSLAPSVVTAATWLLPVLDWETARRLVLAATPHAAGDETTVALMTFCRKCIQCGLVTKANDLLVEIGFHEHWGPLYEAFRAAAEDNPRQLDRLAPEIRTVAREIYGMLRMHDSRNARTHAGAPPNSTSPGSRATRASRQRATRRRSAPAEESSSPGPDSRRTPKRPRSPRTQRPAAPAQPSRRRRRRSSRHGRAPARHGDT